MARFHLAVLLVLASSCTDSNDRDDPPPLGCDDPDRPAGVDWRDVMADEDSDGYGAGPVEPLCLLSDYIPNGWVLAGGPIDCAPQDSSRWSEQPYAGRDADSDGTAVAATGEVCSGDVLPDGYFESPPEAEPDCDDEDAEVWRVAALFADVDEDGIGAGKAADTCIGFDPLPGTSLVGGDCAPNLGEVWDLLDYAYRDADGDGRFIPQESQICSGDALPFGYSNSPGPFGADCDDGDQLAFRTWNVFADQDRDGVGSGDRQTLCAGNSTPDGYALVAGDCAEGDPTLWRVLAYSHRDADEDTYTVAEAGTICSGANLPAGYRGNAGSGPDCNDGDALVFTELTGFEDSDGDGHGAGEVQAFCTDGALPAGAVPTGGDCAPADATLHTVLVSFADEDADGVGAGPAQPLCTGGTRPPGFVATGGDCAPVDSAAWRMLAYGFVDRDEDDRTIAESGQVCAGAALPPPFRATASGNDCDDGDPALLGWAVLYEDGDGDGVGAGPRSIPCIGASIPDGQSIHGDDADDGDPLIQTDEDDESELELILS
jgi:hypothetical protein